MIKLLLISACSALVYSVNIDNNEILEEFKTDTELTNDARINVSLVVAPYGFKDGDNWNVTSVKRLLDVVRRSNVSPDMLRMLELMSKAESYKKSPSLHDGLVNYFYYGSEYEEEEWQPDKSGPLTEKSVIIVSDPVESGLPHSIISINKMKEILWNRAKAGRQMSDASTRKKKTTIKQTTTMEKMLLQLFKSFKMDATITRTTTTKLTTTIDRSTIKLNGPRCLRITELNDAELSAGLIWRVPEGKGRVDTYVIEYKDVSESDWIKGAVIYENQDWNKGEVVPGDQLTATQGDLYKLNKTDYLSGATYQFRVVGYNKAGSGKYSNMAFVRKHCGPVNLTITDLSDIEFRVNLEWEETDKETEVTKYAVEYKQTTETTWTKGVEVPGSKLTTEQNQLVKLNRTDDIGATYEFRVVAINMAGHGNYSDVAVIYKPSYSNDMKLRSFKSSSSSANLTWASPADDGGSPITGYQIQYRIGNTTEWRKGSEVKGDVNLGIQPVENNDVLYEFRVRPINAAGYGEPSEATSGDKPSEPLKFKVTSMDVEQGIAELIWEKPVDDGGWEVTKYQVEYGTRDTDIWQLGTTVPGTDTKATQGGLEILSHEYVFRVRAVNVAGEGNASNEDYINTPTEILKLELLNISPETNTVHLKWSKPTEEIRPDIIGYIIEFKTKEETEWTTGPKIKEKETVEIFLNSSEWIQFQKAINMRENTYEYIVRPYNMGGRGQPSNKDFFDKPSPPPSLKVKKIYPESALISWKKPVYTGNGPITGYNIEYKKENEIEWTRGLNVDGDILEATQTNLQIKHLPHTKYHFRIIAKNKAGPGKPSDAFTYVPLVKKMGIKSGPTKQGIGVGIIALNGEPGRSSELKVDDIVLAADGKNVNSNPELWAVRDKATAGVMELLLLRENKKITIYFCLSIDHTIKVD